MMLFDAICRTVSSSAKKALQDPRHMKASRFLANLVVHWAGKMKPIMFPENKTNFAQLPSLLADQALPRI